MPYRRRKGDHLSPEQTVPTHREIRDSGSVVFHDHIEASEPDDDTPTGGGHRIELTEGEQAVLWDILSYVWGRLRHESAWARGAARADLIALIRKVDRKGFGLL